MPNHGCNFHGIVDDTNYSSPVPAIGLYVAAASSLCLGMMVCDIVAAKLASKSWIPCKWFTLNSVTLTLLSVVCKLPVDLTTPMPSKQDQLSKLTGTAVICVSMGFLAPSLGARNESDCFTNLLALSIFVITIFINICIQLYTGVIALFIPEHIIILCLMLYLLLLLWNISYYTKSRKRITSDKCNIILRRGDSSLFGRLKLCYLYTYCFNPQFEIAITATNAAVCGTCGWCALTVLEATVRCVFVNKVYFCDGHSVYGWSMTPIVVIQILIVAVGSLAVVFRWLKLFRRTEFPLTFNFSSPDSEDARKRNQTLRKGLTLRTRLLHFLTYINWLVIMIIWLGVWLTVQVLMILNLYIDDRDEHFGNVGPQGLIPAGEYIVQKGVEDMIRLMQVNNFKSFNHLCQILSKRCPSQCINGMEIIAEGQSIPIKVCSISIAFLLKVAEISMPKVNIQPLLLAFAEVSEIIHFIDKTIQRKTLKNISQLSYAKAFWTGGDFTCLVPPDDGSQTGLDRAIVVLVTLRGSDANDDHFNDDDDDHDDKTVWFKLHSIIDFINPRELSSMEELYTRIEQLFVDLLHTLLAILPVAIFKSLNESSAEDYEDKVRLCMKFLLQIGNLEGVNWLFPTELNITSFVQYGPQELGNLHGALARYDEVVPCGLTREPSAANIV